MIGALQNKRDHDNNKQSYPRYHSAGCLVLKGILSLMSWLRHKKDQTHGCLERAFIQNGGKHYHVIISILVM